MSDIIAATLTRRIILGLLLGGLMILSYAVLYLFLVPLAWAAILTYVPGRSMRGCAGACAAKP